MSSMDDGTDTSLSADDVIRSGGWDPRYARVLLIEQNGDQALVLVDGNGDGAELELEYWRRDAGGGWQGEASSGHSALESLDAAETWSTGEYVCALGRVGSGSVVRIAYGGRTYSRQANRHGVWGFIHAADSPRAGELPAVAANGS
jgi:hypothetical protein